jgi:hypothetical protein
MLQRLVDAAAVEAEIERVRSLSGVMLRRRWQSEFGCPPPRSLTADLLRRMIANRLQEQAFGTLDRATLKLLDGLARRGGTRRSERNLKTGTVLVRDYQGRRHTVTVGPDGFVWEGASYSSLSAIARAITGTVWNGPRFFAITPTPTIPHAPQPCTLPAETRPSARASKPSPRVTAIVFRGSKP